MKRITEKYASVCPVLFIAHLFCFVEIYRKHECKKWPQKWKVQRKQKPLQHSWALESLTSSSFDWTDLLSVTHCQLFKLDIISQMQSRAQKSQSLQMTSLYLVKSTSQTWCWVQTSRQIILGDTSNLSEGIPFQLKSQREAINNLMKSSPMCN